MGFSGDLAKDWHADNEKMRRTEIRHLADFTVPVPYLWVGSPDRQGVF